MLNGEPLDHTGEAPDRRAEGRAGPPALSLSIGGYSGAGVKAENQDFHGALVPEGLALVHKGAALAVADGISSSAFGAVAAETAVKSFLTDYYCTPDAWSVKASAGRVIAAANSWLHGQSGRMRTDADRDRGHVCTFSALVFKSRTAHIFHVGDSQVARIAGGSVEPLTEPHRIVLSSRVSYLGRALGADAHVEIDYRTEPLEAGDLYLLTTDGVHEAIDGPTIAAIAAHHSDDLDRAAAEIVRAALDAGSDDNLTAMLVRVDALPAGEVDEALEGGGELPPAPLLEAGRVFEGFRVVRELHASARSHLYLAEDSESGARVVLKVPSVDRRDDRDFLRGFLVEQWVARRIDNPHVVKAPPTTRARRYLYTVLEHVAGQTLMQWMHDNPRPGLETVRDIAAQIGRGLQALHRREMLHQDLRPHNVMIDADGKVTLIDLGAARVAGIGEIGTRGVEDRPGTLQYGAPEYLLGASGTNASDIYALGVIVYQLLTGALPYGAQVASATTPAAQRRLRYRSARERNPQVPEWVDAAIARAVATDPAHRYAELSEFLYDLRNPNPVLPVPGARPQLTLGPARAWQIVALALLAALFLLFVQNRQLTARLDALEPATEGVRP